MARVEMSRWGSNAKNGLTYPECPFVVQYNDHFLDGMCNAPCCEDYCGIYCTTRQYVGINECPFDRKKP